MTDKELRHLSRKDLLEMMIEQEKENIRLREALAEAEEKLKNRDIKFRKAGSLAEASLMLNGVFEAAEAAAKQYYENAKKPIEKEDVELIDSGWYIDPAGFHDGIVPVHYYGKIYNPNIEYLADSPAVTAKLQDADGTVITENKETGLYIMPDDTIALMGTLEVEVKDVSENTQILISAECGEITKLEDAEYPMTIDFPADDPEKKEGRKPTISGKVYNRTDMDMEQLEVILILRKEEQIVYLDKTFIKAIKSKKSKVYKFTRNTEWPEHDEMEVVVRP